MSPVLPSGRYFGEAVRDLSSGDLRVVESAIPAGTVLRPHSHENAYLCFVLGGSFEERSGGALRSCEPSLLKFHPAGEEHSERFGPAGAHLFRIEFAGRWRPWTERVAPGERVSLAELRQAVPATLALRREMRRSGCELRIESLALELLAAVLRGRHDDAAPRTCVGLARDFLEAAVDRRPQLDEIARAAGVHPIHLAARFRAEMGCTLGDYSRRVRVRHARERLVATDLPIAEIALLAGFSDQSHLTRAFRAETGMTPAAFRRRHRV